MKPGREKNRVGRPRGSKNLKPAADVEDREVMTLQDVAEYLDCHYTTALKLVQEGVIPSLKLGRQWRAMKSEIDAWIGKGGGRK